MSFENFPYTNFHELNLDWIAKIAKDFLEQYTHIQELIANGEQSLQDLTASGLEDLQEKADALEQLLQEWYNTHSEDIANELASALEDFSRGAYARAQEAIASIPSDYTALYNTVRASMADIDEVLRILEMHSDALNYTNRFDPALGLEGYEIKQDTGKPRANASVGTSDFIRAIQNATLKFSYNGAPILKSDYWVLYVYRYDADRQYIGYETIGSDSDTAAKYVIQNADVWIRFCYSLKHKTTIQAEYNTITPFHAAGLISNDLAYKANATGATFKAINSTNVTGQTKSILRANGALTYNDSFRESLIVTDLLRIDALKNCVIKNAESWILADGWPLAFYDRFGNIIGTAYSPTADTAEKSVDITISDTLIANYPNAVFIRIGGNANTYISNSKEAATAEHLARLDALTYADPFPSYKFNIYDSFLFCGDSVTEGFIVNWPEYNVNARYCYPHLFNLIHPELNITIKAHTGDSPTRWRERFYNEITFSDYQWIIFELGYNGSDYGYLRVNELDTPGTNTYNYRQLIADVRAAAPNANIVLVNSSRSGNSDTTPEDPNKDWMPILNAIAAESTCYVIDLKDKRYINLNRDRYHGNMENGAKDYAHFNRRGYNAKAFVFERLLSEQLI